jgi:phosphatidylserine decarboxylase
VAVPQKQLREMPRHYPAGCIFNHAGSRLDPHDVHRNRSPLIGHITQAALHDGG